jgi:lipopolysaccharide export system protein LptA
MSKNIITKFLFISFFLLAPVRAEEFKAKNIDVKSDFFSFDLDDSLMIFEKNVFIKYYQFDASCQKAIISFNDVTKKVNIIKLIGKVKLKKNSSEISGDKIIINIEKNKIEVEGNVKTKINLDN